MSTVISGVSLHALTDPAGTTPPVPTSPTDPLANKDVFLQLLVAQLKNQNPLSPTDGTQFVSQLAQFTGLEQSTQMRQDLDAILAQLKATATPPAGGK